jgi:ubiquinone/menaquinone biosynthesis C-methylase UbiE
LEFYQGRANQYEDTLHLTFKTHSLDEVSTRQTFIDKLNLKNDSKVLEIACGTGRDSVLIANRLSKGGELHLQDLSSDMLRICHDKLKDHDSVSSFALANAQYLPYPDHYFDGVYSFGALGEFSDIALALKEMVRVSKTGAKIVIGDESVPSWLRNTNYFKILKETNPMFEAKLPLDALPIEARNTSIHYVIGQTFYLIEFEVGKGEPSADFDFEIPGVRGGTYRTRYEGKLEGVSKEAYKLAWEKVKNDDLNMHNWLSNLIIKELKNK